MMQQAEQVIIVPGYGMAVAQAQHVLREMIYVCRPAGILSISGVYGGLLDKIQFGAAMNKGPTFRMGQTHVNRWSADLLSRIERGQIEFGPDETTQPQRIYYLDENMYENVPSVLPFAGSDDALSLDAMKAIAASLGNPGPLTGYMGKAITGCGPKMIAIPTTAGTVTP